MKKFGFGVRAESIIELSKADLSLRQKLIEAYGSYNTCINCGVCSAACTAAQLTNFNIRDIKLKIDRGLTENLRVEISRCMHCGKCEMLCPRGISNRQIILLTNKFLRD